MAHTQDASMGLKKQMPSVHAAICIKIETWQEDQACTKCSCQAFISDVVMGPPNPTTAENEAIGAHPFFQSEHSLLNVLFIIWKNILFVAKLILAK